MSARESLIDSVLGVLSGKEVEVPDVREIIPRSSESTPGRSIYQKGEAQKRVRARWWSCGGRTRQNSKPRLKSWRRS